MKLQGEWGAAAQPVSSDLLGLLKTVCISDQLTWEAGAQDNIDSVQLISS